VDVENCIVTTNLQGGIAVAGVNGDWWGSPPGVVTVRNNVFAGNSSPYGSNPGSGIGCGGTATITGNTFMGNTAVNWGSGWNGSGGVYCSGNAIITDNTFVNNSNNAAGSSAIYCQAAATITGNTFNLNLGGWSGCVYCGDTAIIVSNTFTGNSGSSCSSAALIAGNSFVGNFSSGHGGAISCYGSPTTIIGNMFTGNTASGGFGGGAFCAYIPSGNTPVGAATVSSNMFVLNSAQTGGGLYIGGLSVILQGNLVINNSQTSASSQGGGVWVNATSNLFMINNTIFGNTAAGSGGGAAFQVNGTVELLNIYNNIIWGNSANGNGGDVWLAGTGQEKVFDNNDVNNMYGVWDIAQNLLNVDPQFFNAVGGDYHLQSTSPCRNAGTNGAPSLPLTDLDGNLRTNALGQVDLGCYEFNTTATHPADTNATFVITPGEYAAYAAAWKAGQTWTNAPSSAPNPNPIPANYVTRAGYLMTNGGAYYNNGSARPTNWRPLGQ
jgi:hypothetical protein